MGYIYIPETKRAKDVRIDNYDKKFPSDVNNVELALRYLKENNSLTTYQFIDLRDMGIEFSNARTIVESLDILIDTCNPKINQVYRGQCLASDKPNDVANGEIEITILKHLSNDKQADTIDNRDVVCQIVLSSIDVEPYRWFMITERVGSDTNSVVKVALRPMLPSEQSIDLSNYATIDDLNAKADKNNLVATNSISMGRKNGTKIGENSCAIGNNCVASGEYSHAEGYNTTASGNHSHAEGENTIASNYGCHAEGVRTTASESYSHVEGLYNFALSKYQHVQGKYNIKDPNDKYAHIIGNGTSNTVRSNAHTVDWNGVGWFASDLYTGGTGQDDTNAKKIATEEFVNNIISNLLSFNENGELIVTIGDVSKTFVAKTE